MRKFTSEKIKFLADVNVEKPLVDFLREKDFDVKWVAEIKKDMEDDEVLKMAYKEKRILLTNDKDFGELVFRQKKLSQGVVLLRIKGQDIKKKINLMSGLIEKYSFKILKHFVVVTENKIRLIPLEVKK